MAKPPPNRSTSAATPAATAATHFGTKTPLRLGGSPGGGGGGCSAAPSAGGVSSVGAPSSTGASCAGRSSRGDSSLIVLSPAFCHEGLEYAGAALAHP